MKIALRPALLLTLVGLLASACIAPARYTALEHRSNYFEQQYKDLASFHGQLEAENERLRGELALYQGKGPIDASATQDIDERLARLKQLTEAIGTSSGAAPISGASASGARPHPPPTTGRGSARCWPSSATG